MENKRLIDILLLTMILMGCDGSSMKESHEAINELPRHEVSADGKSSSVDTNAVDISGNADGDCNEQMDEIFQIDLSKVPFENRYSELIGISEKLWKLLDATAGNDVEVVLCAAARLQRMAESELDSVVVPERAVDRGPLQRSDDGVPYYLVTKDVARMAIAEDKKIGGTIAYREELKHFIGCYPNRIDGPAMRSLFYYLPSNRRHEVGLKLQGVLGRKPRWLDRPPRTGRE